MAQISIRGEDPEVPFTSGEVPLEYAGSFDTRTAQYWGGDGRPRKVQIPGGAPDDYELQERDNERLWRTADGRWVLTNGPVTSLLSDDEAEQWFVDNGYSAEDRDALVRSGHRD